MTSFERASGDRIERRPPPELAFWACLAIVAAMGVIGLIIGIAVSEFWGELSDPDSWVDTVLAILVLSAPAAMLYLSVFCRFRLAAAAMTVCLCIVSIGAFFGMLAATFYSETATVILLVVFGVALRVGHLNSCWYSVLKQEDIAPQLQFRRLDLALTVVSVVIMTTVAAWTWTR